MLEFIILFIIIIVVLIAFAIVLGLLFPSETEKGKSSKDVMKIMFTIKILVIRGFLALVHIFTWRHSLKGVEVIDKSTHPSNEEK